MESHSLDLVEDQEDEGRDAPMPRSPMETDDRTGLLDCETDQKENVCHVQDGNLGAPAIFGDFSLHKKRNRKGRGFNLRKSLAWNQAFFTEKGVLDPQELSILNKSTAKSSRRLSSVKEMSPLTVYNTKSSVRSPLHDLEANKGTSGFTTKFQSKDSMPSKLFSSSSEELEAHTSGKTPSIKGVCRSFPRSLATYSEKRVANASTTNPTLKLPKFMPAKSHAPFPETSKNAISTRKSSKLDQSLAKVGQNHIIRRPHVKVDLACSSSSSNVSAEHVIYSVEDSTTSLKTTQNQSSSTKLHEAITYCSGKIVSSLPQRINHIHGGPPAPVHARPSALRMPSPSLGFFSHGKVSPSSNDQPYRHSQPPESKISSLRNPVNPRQNGQLMPLSTSVGKISSCDTDAVKCTAAAGKQQACLPLSCSKTAAPDNYLHPKANLEKKLAVPDGVSTFLRFESSHCENDIDDRLRIGQFLVGQAIHGEPEKSLVEKVDSDTVKIAQSSDCSFEVNESSVQVNQQSLQFAIPETIHDIGRSTGDSNELNFSCSVASQVHSPQKLLECEPKEIHDESGINNLTEQSNDNIAREACQVAIKNELPVGNSDGASVLTSKFRDRSVDRSADTEPELTLKEALVDTGLGDNLILDLPLTPPRVSAQVELPGSDCVKSGQNANSPNIEPECLEERAVQECRLHCDLTIGISSGKPDATTRSKMCQDIPKQADPMNVVPFTDEWVAALEAFGEEILVKKTGPVQNSPPDKAEPEPGPWSPVKKKAQDIGPFDCTKYSKNLTD